MTTATFRFPDAGLHIAVMGALLDQGALTEEVIRAALNQVSGDDDLDRLAAGIRVLHQMAFSEPDLETVQHLDFDGGNDIYMLLEECADCYTGGETDDYELRSLEGLAKLSSLDALDLDGHGYRRADLDLHPLANHPTLQRVCLTGSVVNIASLESIAPLTALSVEGVTVDDPTVLDRLEDRGVAVKRDETNQ